MFGMGGSEIIVILIVALLFLGPDKLPQAAKTISKGIRDIKKQSRALQQQIEGDEQIGGAIRDLKSALRGDENPPRSIRPPKKAIDAELLPTENTIANPPLTGGDRLGEATETSALATAVATAAAGLSDPARSELPALSEVPALSGPPVVTLPASAGEADGPSPTAEDDADLASMIKPASGTVAKGS